MAFDPAAPLPTLTPDSIKRKRLLAEALTKQGMDYSPILSPWQGVARLASALVGGAQTANLDRQEAEGQKSANEALMKAFGSLTDSGGSQAQVTNPPEQASKLPTFAATNGQMTDPNGPAATAFNFFVSKGYTPAAAAGIVGNLRQESNFNPNARNPGDGRDGSDSIGIAQWNSDRARRLMQFAQANNRDPRDMNTQLEFAAHELSTTEGRVGQALKGVNDPVQAAGIAAGYLRPAGWRQGGDPSAVHGWQNRSGSAQAIFNALGGKGVQVASNDPGFVPSAKPTGMMAYAPAQPDMPAAPQPQQAPQQVAQAQPQTPPDPTADAGNPIPPQQIIAAANSPQVQQAAQQAAQTPQGKALIQQAQNAPMAALMAAMANPWLSDGQKSLLMMLAKEKMDPVRNTVDLGGSIAVMDKQGNILKTIPKQRDALDDESKRLDLAAKKQALAGGTPQQQEAARLDIETKRKALNMPNGEILKDESGNPIGFFDKQTLEFKPIAGLPEGEKKAPTTRVVKQADGSEVAVQWDGKKKEWVPLQAPQGGNPVTNPKLTEQQSKDVVFYNRGSKVLDRMETQEKALTDAWSAAGGQVSNFLKSDAYRQAEQTGRELLAVILRKDTGAAITNQEMEQYGSMFLPKPGDDATTISQKRQARRVAIESIRMGLGPADAIFRAQEALQNKPNTPPAQAPAKVRRYNKNTGQFEVVE